MQGLGIRLARRINRATHRKGSLWTDRYHARKLTTPTEVRNALVYVLQNRKKHGALSTHVDPMSSGPLFSGWSDYEPSSDDRGICADPRTWLLRVGWKKRGLISIHESPSS
jgi:hypothetical protein